MRRISPSCRSYRGSRSRLIRMAPRALGRPIWFRCGLVHWIGPTIPANSAHGGQALLKCYEPTIREAAFLIIVIGAPRIVLRLSGVFDAADSREKKPHGRLPNVAALPSRYKLLSSCFISSSRATRRGGLRPTWRSCLQAGIPIKCPCRRASRRNGRYKATSRSASYSLRRSHDRRKRRSVCHSATNPVR